MKGVIVKKFSGAGNWYILGEDGIEYFLGFKQCVNKEKYFKEGVSVTFDVKDTGKKRLEAWNCIAEEPPRPKKTNADRIRSMTDRELASFITFQVERKENTHAGERFNRWFEWLKEEVKAE